LQSRNAQFDIDTVLFPDKVGPLLSKCNAAFDPFILRKANLQDLKPALDTPDDRIKPLELVMFSMVHPPISRTESFRSSKRQCCPPEKQLENVELYTLICIDSFDETHPPMNEKSVNCESTTDTRLPFALSKYRAAPLAVTLVNIQLDTLTAILPVAQMTPERLVM
jgi:hypothetical protein